MYSARKRARHTATSHTCQMSCRLAWRNVSLLLHIHYTTINVTRAIWRLLKAVTTVFSVVICHSRWCILVPRNACTAGHRNMHDLHPPVKQTLREQAMAAKKFTFSAVPFFRKSLLQSNVVCITRFRYPDIWWPYARGKCFQDNGEGISEAKRVPWLYEFQRRNMSLGCICQLTQQQNCALKRMVTNIRKPCWGCFDGSKRRSLHQGCR